MGRPLKEVAGPNALAPALLRLVVEHGGDPALLAVQCGLDASAADLDEVAITPSSLALLVRSVSEVLADPHGALRFPFEAKVRRYDGVGLALRSARTPREVMMLAARYAPLLFPQLAIAVADGEEVVLTAQHAGHPRGLGLLVDELILATLLAHCRRGGSEVTPARVWLTSARPRTIEPLLEALRTSAVTFGERDTGFALGRAAADRELPGYDAAMLVTAEQLAGAALASAPRAGSLASLVATRLEALLAEAPTTDAVAASLHMSGRTLQRRLEEEGTRFSAVLDVARERAARRLLDDRALPLTEVAFRAGFADLASFSRAFKRWTGMPPGAYRRR
ncbi:MAG: Transcriptional regulator, AraC family [Labilithrix sp.]|nr:Transcriptional regulator, AraC family [Labilithrix sp.]